MNVKCIDNTGKENYLTIGNVYEVLERKRNYGKTWYRLISDRSKCDWRQFPRSLFKQTNEPVSPIFPFRVKCKFDYTWVFPLSGGHYQRSLSEYITVGNVYEVTDIRGDNYVFLPDHGTRTRELPYENFEPTNEPVTINPLRAQEETEKERKAKEYRDRLENDREQQAITDSLDQYYNPDKYRARQLAKQRTANVLSQIFTCGIPYV
jgi:hypothetical protein